MGKPRPGRFRAELGPVGLRELSLRQFEVAMCVGRGLSNQEIADELGISVSTVTGTANTVYQRMGLFDHGHARARLALLAAAE